MKQKAVLVVLAIVGSTMFSYAQNKKEAVALNWLTTHQARLSIQSNHSFEMLFSKKSIAGETFRYYQMIHGVQVYDSEVTVHVSNNNQVTFNQSTYDNKVPTINTIPAISKQKAMKIAKQHINAGTIAFEKNELFIYNKTGKTLLTYVITIEPKGTPIGSWEVVINALTGDVISAMDKAYYYNGNHEKQQNKGHKKESIKRKKGNVNGSGFVYETDPLTATLNVYGGQYVDANDATNAALDAARSNVTLLDITQTGGQFFLTGPYSEIQDFEAPNKGLFSQGTSVFNFNRNQDGFEAVNVYYHIDKSMRYYNETLGLSVMPYQYTSGVRADPSGLSGADNSHYLPGSGRLAFGEGCVDDGEDADVIIHELGHGIHDWITNGATSAYLGEGNGDYLAASYKRSFGQWLPSDASYDFMFGWDGNNPCWPGRTTADTRTYPNGLVGLQNGAAHIDGQMWSSTLMEIWDIIGREKTDKAFIEGIAMTNSNTNQEQAAIAVRQAAIDMGAAGGYTCEDIQVFTDRFTARGYSLPTYTCTLSVDTFETASISIFPNPTNGRLTFMNLTQEHEIAVFNMLGQRVQEQTVNTSENTLDVSQLATGTYFIKFSEADTILKFVKE